MKSTFMEKLIAGLGLVIAGFLLIVVIACLLAWPVMLLWNACLVGAIAGVNVIGFWQALGLLILSGLLFKSSSSKCSK